MSGVPAKSIFHNTSVIEAVWHKLRAYNQSNLQPGCEAVWHKLRAYNQSNLQPGCINVNLSDFWMTMA
jgi:hypothetical protein